ncbi:MAG: glycosyltransferase family 39 protein [Isosphaeraceae bacterium]|nr:glycosyltransferase family 39 protein [Isosphaeraceae bacterium]
MDVAINALWALAILGPTSVGAWWSARSGLRRGRDTDALPTAFLLAWVWTTWGMLVLGNLGMIGRPGVSAWSLAGLAVGGACRIRWGRGPEPDRGDRPQDALGFEVAAAIGVGLWVVISLATRSWIYPVKVVSDGPIYHLYFAARWWKEGALSLVPIPFGESAAPYFPHVGELMMTWLFTAAGGDALAKLAQVPFWFVSFGVAVLTARELGARRSSAILAASVFATSTPSLLFTFEPNVDTIFVAGYMLAVYFFVRAIRDSTGSGRIELALGAVAAGAAWGTKPTGIVFVPVLLAFVAIAWIRKSGGLRKAGAGLAVLALGPLAMEGYWQARNLFWTGNPLYPLRLEVGGRVIAWGWYGPDAMPTSPYYLPFNDFAALGDILLASVDPRLAPIWAAALILGVLGVGPKEGRSARRWITLACLANLALFWIAIPYRTQQRFLFHALALGAVPIAALLDRSRWLRIAAAGLIVLHLATPQGWPWSDIPWDLSPIVPNRSPAPAGPLIDLAGFSGPNALWSAWQAGVILGCLGVGFLVTGASWTTRAGRLRTAAAVGLTLACVAGTAVSILPDRSRAVLLEFPAFPDYFAAWIRVDGLTRARPARIAYSGTNLAIYWMGRDYRNDVRAIAVDEHRDWALHDHHRAALGSGQPDPWPDTRPNWDRMRPNREAWLANLEAAGIDYVVVARANPSEGRFNAADAEGFPIERQWAESLPDRFAPVYGVEEGDPLIKVYQLRRSR